MLFPAQISKPEQALPERITSIESQRNRPE